MSNHKSGLSYKPNSSEDLHMSESSAKYNSQNEPMYAFRFWIYTFGFCVSDYPSIAHSLKTSNPRQYVLIEAVPYEA